MNRQREKEKEVVKRLNKITDEQDINFYSMPQEEFSKWIKFLLKQKC